MMKRIVRGREKKSGRRRTVTITLSHDDRAHENFDRTDIYKWHFTLYYTMIIIIIIKVS